MLAQSVIPALPRGSVSNVLAYCEQEIDRHEAFLYYPTYNPLKALGITVKTQVSSSDRPYLVKPKEINQQLDRVIDEFRRCVKQAQAPSESVVFVDLYQKAAPIIEKYSESHSAKALSLKVIAAQNRLVKCKSEAVKKWSLQAIKHNYPLALYLYGIILMQEKNLADAYWYIYEASIRGQRLAYLALSDLYMSLDTQYFNLPAAYTYNLMGSHDIFQCCVRLAMMHINGLYAPRSVDEALLLLDRAQSMVAVPNPRLLQIMSRLWEIKQTEDKLHKQAQFDLKVNDLQESWIIEEHLRYLQGGAKQLVKDFYTPQQSCTNIFQQKTKVFRLAERTVQGALTYQLLVLNQEGVFDRICIHLAEHRDRRYPRDLLRKVGTKITLNFYNRKLALDGILQYCVVNPVFVQFQAPSGDAEQYRLPTSRIREAAKRLFNYEMYERCIFLYDYLAQKCPQDSASLYCNISLCLARQQRYRNAEVYALRSIAAKPQCEKFIYRLSYCLWKLGKPDEAKQRLLRLKSLCPDSQFLLDSINKDLVARAQQLDFSSKKYCRTHAPIFKQLYLQIDRYKQYELFLTNSQVLGLVRSEEQLVRSIMGAPPQLRLPDLVLKVNKLIKLPLEWAHEATAYPQIRQLFGLVYGYVKHHTGIQLFTMKDILNHIDSYRIDETLSEPVRTTVKVLALRQTHLENRIETAVLNKLDFGKTEEAIELCRLANPHNEILIHRCIELLRSLEQYDEALSMSCAMIDKLQKARLSFEEFAMSNAKTYRAMGEYKESNRYCSILYTNRHYPSEAHLLKSRNLFSCKCYDEALAQADLACLSARHSSEAGLHRIRCLLKTGKLSDALESARELEGYIQSNRQQHSKNILIKACLNLQLEALMALKDHREFVMCCDRICQLDKRNINFVEDKLWLFMREYSWLEELTLLEVQSHAALKEVAVGIRQKQAQLKEDDLNSTDETVQLEPNSCIDPRVLHEQHKKQKQLLESPSDSEIHASLDLANSLEQQYPGYVAHFHHNSRLFVILFDEDMWLDPLERDQFYRAAAKGLARAGFSCSGIKILNDGLYELKIMHSDYRLIGRNQSRTEDVVIRFNRRTNHNLARRIAQHG